MMSIPDAPWIRDAERDGMPEGDDEEEGSIFDDIESDLKWEIRRIEIYIDILEQELLKRGYDSHLQGMKDGAKYAMKSLEYIQEQTKKQAQ